MYLPGQRTSYDTAVSEMYTTLLLTGDYRVDKRFEKGAPV
jgi:hypothetical protein